MQTVAQAFCPTRLNIKRRQSTRRGRPRQEVILLTFSLYQGKTSKSLGSIPLYKGSVPPWIRKSFEEDANKRMTNWGFTEKEKKSWLLEVMKSMQIGEPKLSNSVNSNMRELLKLKRA